MFFILISGIFTLFISGAILILKAKALYGGLLLGGGALLSLMTGIFYHSKKHHRPINSYLDCGFIDCGYFDCIDCAYLSSDCSNMNTDCDILPDCDGLGDCNGIGDCDCDCGGADCG